MQICYVVKWWTTGSAINFCLTGLDCARVAAAPAALECRLTQIVTLPGAANKVVFGEVVGVHIDDACLRDGIFDVTTFQPLARLGYRDYSVVTELFSLSRPGE